MATTTNFGWETPDDTDLVKDGALAIRTLGSAIDTSLVDLKGGTTGQVLSKTSNTDMDFTWVTSDDANAIQNTIVDAKGDLISASAADVPARLAVGNNGETLIADSSTATGLKWAKDPVADLVTTAGDTLYATAADTLTRLGIGTAGQVLTVNSGATAPEWKTPTSGTTFSGVKCKKSASQTIVDGTETALTFDQEDFDTDSFHSTSTNTSRITIPSGKGGYYLFIANVTWNGNATGYRSVALKKNGSNLSPVNKQEINGQGSSEFGQIISYIVSAVATDYFESFVLQNSGGNLGVASAFFQAIYLGA